MIVLSSVMWFSIYGQVIKIMLVFGSFCNNNKCNNYDH